MPTIGETSRPGFVYDSATDTWIPVGIGPHAHTPAAIGAIASSVVTTKGDLIVATGSGTVVRQGVGADGSMLVADSSQADGVNYALGNAFAAGKNKFINGDFSVWQRGTSFTNPADNTYNCDRYRANGNGSGVTKIISRQAFTPGTAPVAGYEGQFFYRFAQTVAGTGATYNNGIQQPIEDVRTFAGQTVTWSFWAKADATRTVFPNVERFYGSGGTGYEYINLSSVTITTNWTRYSLTFVVPSIAGKTLGAGSYFMPYIGFDSNTVQTFDFWGFQIESGSVATPFQTATGNPQGELAACQRYYYRTNPVSNAYSRVASGRATSTTNLDVMVPLPVAMRTTPTSVDFASLMTTTANTISAIALTQSTTTTAVADCTTSGLTSGSFNQIMVNNSTSGYIGFSAELQ
jgi:hypothetical protein